MSVSQQQLDDAIAQQSPQQAQYHKVYSLNPDYSPDGVFAGTRSAPSRRAEELAKDTGFGPGHHTPVMQKMIETMSTDTGYQSQPEYTTHLVKNIYQSAQEQGINLASKQGQAWYNQTFKEGIAMAPHFVHPQDKSDLIPVDGGLYNRRTGQMVVQSKTDREHERAQQAQQALDTQLGGSQPPQYPISQPSAPSAPVAPNSPPVDAPQQLPDNGIPKVDLNTKLQQRAQAILNNPELAHNLGAAGKDIVAQAKENRKEFDTYQAEVRAVARDTKKEKRSDDKDQLAKDLQSGKLSPQQEATAQRIVNRQAAPFTNNSRTKPEFAAIMNRVQELDPQYSDTDFKNMSDTQKNFRNGKMGQTIVAINQTMHHLSDLNDTSKALSNEDYAIINKSRNWFNDTGLLKANPALAAYRYNALAVENELAKAYGGGGHPAEGEIKKWREAFSDAKTPVEQQAVMQKALNLLGGVAGTMQEQYKNSGARDNFPILHSGTKQILEELGGDVSKWGSAASGGQSSRAPAGGLQLTPAIVGQYKQKYGSDKAAVAKALAADGYKF